MSIPKTILSKINKIHSLIASDVNNRGMKHLIVEGDFLEAAKLFARLPAEIAAKSLYSSMSMTIRTSNTSNPEKEEVKKPLAVILSGFPCLVKHTPPTETDGPNGAFALAHCGLALGYRVVIVTDECNYGVFEKGLSAMFTSYHDDCYKAWSGECILKSFPAKMTPVHEEELQNLSQADLIIACERAGPAHDGKCYTMRGIDMNEHGLIAPIHKIVEFARTRKGGAKFIGIGDGGNELGMGKVISQVKEHIPLGETIGCVCEADYLIAASVSNWGAYALCGAAALIRANDCSEKDSSDKVDVVKEWVDNCLVSDEADLKILKECMAAGCRDGINQRLDEPFVDGMPAERSLECLRAIWDEALSKEELGTES